MRIALMSDVHGNFVALQAVLGDIDRANVNQIICLGDVAAVGPQPAQTIQRLRSLGCPIVLGNTDDALVHLPPQHTAHDPGAADLREEAVTRWTRAQLSADDRTYVQSFAPTVRLALEGGQTLLCFHGSPRSYDDIILSTTPAAQLDRLLADAAPATILAGGHTHVQMLRRHRALVVLNPGSVGLPYDQNPWSGEVPKDDVRLAPWAEYALLHATGGAVAIEFRRVPLKVQEVADAAVGSGVPYAEEWRHSWLAARAR